MPPFHAPTMKRVGQPLCCGLVLLSLDVATMDSGGQVVGSKLRLLPNLVNVALSLSLLDPNIVGICTLSIVFPFQSWTTREYQHSLVALYQCP